MRLLTTEQLKRLRAIAVADLESSSVARKDLGIAPEDLLVACDRALGWDDMADEDESDRRALRSTSRDQCARAWRRR